LSSAVRGNDASNFVRVILHGIAPSGNAAGPVMPGFANALNDAEVARLVTYVRASFTDRPAFPNVEAAVREARAVATR
jgi:mono/diheme cytochrome c family protein